MSAPAWKQSPRNPVLELEAAALREVLLGIRAEARAKAEESWRRNKGPMAAYWKAVAVYAGHTARALRRPS